MRSTKKFKILCCENSENKIKAEHPKKLKVLGCKKSRNKKKKLSNDTDINPKCNARCRSLL